MSGASGRSRRTSRIDSADRAFTRYGGSRCRVRTLMTVTCTGHGRRNEDDVTCPRLLGERLSLPRVLDRADEGSEIIIVLSRVFEVTRERERGRERAAAASPVPFANGCWHKPNHEKSIRESRSARRDSPCARDNIMPSELLRRRTGIRPCARPDQIFAYMRKSYRISEIGAK